MTILLAITGCKKDTETTFAINDESAIFSVNGVDFSMLNEMHWLRNGTQHSLQFMKQMTNGDQHSVIVIFNGDTAGTYPLLGINSIHRGSYFAPDVNGTTFEDTIQPGKLVITKFDTGRDRLSGSYTFAVDTFEIAGQFQNLRPD